MSKYEKFGIKYELCEIILCDVNEKLREYGFTVMDGPFFSIMPFGKMGLHSLTSVTFTPHSTSYDATPTFHDSRAVENVWTRNASEWFIRSFKQGPENLRNSAITFSAKN